MNNLGNIVQFSETWPLQSYFDAAAEITTPPSTASLEQPPLDQIVPSTLRDKTNQSGFSLGLAPWSQAPVAVQFSFGDQGASATVILKPGQIFRPNGGERFVGFTYGLPFGWLGGGNVTLFLFKTPDARVDWTGYQSEVLFHRLRTTILAATVPLTAPSYRNWPNRFPWPYMYRYATTPEFQAAQSSLAIAEVTRTLLRLNNDATVSLPTDQGFRMVFWGTDDFGTSSDGTTVTGSDQLYTDLSWPDPTSLVAGSYDNPVISLDRNLAALSGNTWGVALYAPAGSTLIGKTVDICRYGRL